MAKRIGNNTCKLHYIKPRIEEWESAYNSCRQYEVKLSRIKLLIFSKFLWRKTYKKSLINNGDLFFDLNKIIFKFKDIYKFSAYKGSTVK